MSNFSRFQFSGPSQRAMEEFSDEFKDAFALAAPIETWAAQLGYVASVQGASKITFPIPLDAAGFHEFDGDARFRDMYGRTISVITKKWQDGVKAEKRKLGQELLVDWIGAPSRMATEWQRLPNLIASTLLASGAGANGPVLDLYRDPDTNAAGTRQLFAADHPFNPLNAVAGTFNNIIPATTAGILNGTYFDTLDQYFRDMKGPNGQSLGLTLEGGSLLVPSALANLNKRALESDYLIHAVNNLGNPDAVTGVVAAERGDNRWKGITKRVVGIELTQPAVMYAIAGGKPGIYPWMVAQESAPEEIVFDESDEMYKKQGLIALSYQGEANGGAALPQAIVKITVS